MPTMIAQTIQLALAPVFVLVAIGSIMNILSSRLGRVVDRARQLEARYQETEGEEHDAIVREIRMADRRLVLLNRAILILVASAMCIGTTVVLLFLEEFAHAGLQPVAAGVFILAITLLMAALLLFLMETREAAAALRIPRSYLETDRKL